MITQEKMNKMDMHRHLLPDPGAEVVGQLIEELRRLYAVLDSPELMEILADIEHERWSGWERYRESVACEEREAHWKRLRETPYAELPEHSKESDRVEVRKTLRAISDAIEAGHGTVAPATPLLREGIDKGGVGSPPSSPRPSGPIGAIKPKG